MRPTGCVPTAFKAAGCPETGVALVAVGGYGRQELAPFSDLDVVLVHDHEIEMGEWAGQVWYPLWDSGANIDHSVRSVQEVLDQGASDLRVATGMLDARHLAGDPNLTLRLRTAVLNQWRRDARTRLEELRELVSERGRKTGELAHASIPDLKESVGGLRDATVLKALVASWLVDVPHGDLERGRVALLDVRDALHTVAGRATDRVAPEFWEDIARVLDLPDGNAAQVHTRRLARRITHLSRLAWRRAEAVQRRSHPGGERRPRLEPIAPGVAVSYEEVVLDRGAKPAQDPLLLLRAATEAAERDLVLAPTTAARLVRESPPLPDPWPAGARDLFVRLLAAGPGLLGVWETLDETGALDLVLPEWERVRLLPHASAVHRFTVDRHLVETCIEASQADPPSGAPRRADGGRAAARHRQGPADRALRGGRPDRPRDRGADRLRQPGGRAGHRDGPLAPAPARDGHHPRPRRPGDGRAGHRQGGRPRGARAAGRPHRGGCARHLGEGVDPLAGLADPESRTPIRGRSRRRARAHRRGDRDRAPRTGPRRS